MTRRAFSKKRKGSIAIEAAIAFSLSMLILMAVLATVLSVVASDDADWTAMHTVENINVVNNALLSAPNADIAVLGVLANGDYLVSLKEGPYATIGAPVCVANDEYGSVQMIFHYKFNLRGAKEGDSIVLPAAGFQASDGIDFDEEMVFITKTGECYHEGSCWHLRKSKLGINKEEAVEKGYRPCKNCH